MERTLDIHTHAAECRFVLFETCGLVFNPLIPLPRARLNARFAACGEGVDAHLTSHMMRTGLCLDFVVTERLKGQVPDWAFIADQGGWKASAGASGTMAEDYHCPQLFWGRLSHMVCTFVDLSCSSHALCALCTMCVGLWSGFGA